MGEFVQSREVTAGVAEQRSAARQAAMAGSAEAVKRLIAKNALVNAIDRWGMTPLHNAANDGNTEAAELLIKKGADVNANLKDGATPLDIAIRKKQDDVAAILKKHGGKQ